ncbi:MAG: DNA-3-methyladenine glycosylase I [Congregibacter sp.]
MPSKKNPLHFETVFSLACERKGGEAAVLSMLPKPASKQKLKKLSSDRCLAEFTRKIFQSGFVWRVVDQKWPGFEEVFWNFDIERLLLMPDEMLERKAQDTAIIRNYAKVKTVRDNALMIAETERREAKLFGHFVADWPSDDVIGLWLYLKKNGSRLGGNTGPFALRTLGVDTFLFTRDVEGFLRNRGVIDGGINTLKSLRAAQNYFNELREQSGLSLSALSRLVSYSFGKNEVGVAVAD